MWIQKKWIQEEIDFLKRYPGRTHKWYAEKLNRSVKSIEMKIIKLGLVKKQLRFWTSDEDAFFKKYYRIYGIAGCVTVLGRSAPACSARAKRLKIRVSSYGSYKISYDIWKKAIVAYYFNGYTRDEVVAEFNITNICDSLKVPNERTAYILREIGGKKQLETIRNQKRIDRRMAGDLKSVTNGCGNKFWTSDLIQYAFKKLGDFTHRNPENISEWQDLTEEELKQYGLMGLLSNYYDCSIRNFLEDMIGKVSASYYKRNGRRSQYRVYNLLSSIFDNVYFEESYQGLRFPETKRLMKFDIVIYRQDQSNIIIEYQGRQHYEPVEAYGGEDSYKLTVKNDKLKRLITQKMGVVYIEIPYHKWDGTLDCLKKILKENGVEVNDQRQFSNESAREDESEPSNSEH